MLGTFLRSIKEAYVDDMIRFVRPSQPFHPLYTYVCVCVVLVIFTKDTFITDQLYKWLHCY